MPIFSIVRIEVLPEHALFLLLVDYTSDGVDHDRHFFEVLAVELVDATGHDAFYNVCLSRTGSLLAFGSFCFLLEYLMVDVLETIEDKSSVVVCRSAVPMQ